ncbi:MAG: response regulator transcription factor [Dehalococcoidales bacterium]|nr:response regulator transcription factor [Dehalococcoidales bacterium]
MDEVKPVVFVVDDDVSVRKSLSRLLTLEGFDVSTFASARVYLDSGCCDTPECLILDVRLPGLDGLELQKTLVERKSTLSIVFITGHGDIPMSVQAMKAGAVDFLSKPFSDEALLNAVNQAVAKSRRERAHSMDVAAIRERLSKLTPRENEVLNCVVAGHLNKQIASIIGVAEKTVKVHRGHIMQKMQVQSVAELVRMLEKINR